MHAILSPAESLGLASAAGDSRLRNASHHVSDETLIRISDTLRDDALSNDVVYERAGEREPIRIMLRPLLAHRDQLTYVNTVCRRVTDALKRLPSLYLESADVRKLVAVRPDEESWVRDIWTPAHARTNTVYGRLDAVCDFLSPAWQATFKLMEANLSGVGGIHFAPIAEQLVMRDVVPTLLAHDPDLAIELPQDQRDLFVQVLIDHARMIGRESCQMGFLEPRFVHEGPDEQSSLSRYFEQREHLTIAHADPRELSVRDEEVYFEDTRIDVAYRDYELRDLIALEADVGRPLEGMRRLFRENRVVSSLSGDFDHKSAFELLTDLTWAERYFSSDDCRLFRRHVLWTRLVYDRRTTLSDNRMADLLEYIRSHREQLVLKPNRGYGGEGVSVGATMQDSDWEAIIQEAVAHGDDPEKSWVVQAATPLPVAEFPVVGPDLKVYDEPFYAVMGFAATDHGLGVLCRVSQKQVVNVAQHGGIAALLIGRRPKDLRIPRRPLAATQDTRTALRKQIAELRHLDQAIALLEWDEETKLPLKGRMQRGEQMSALEGLRHSLLTADRLGDLIEEVALRYGGDADLGWELDLLRRERKIARAIPEALVRSFANAKSQALAAWEEAREKNEFAVFALPFSQLLALVRARAECLAAGGDLYDALMDQYEPGMTRPRLDPLLRSLCQRLVPLVHSAANAGSKMGQENPPARFPAAGQWQLCTRVLKCIGFDFDRGRFDSSTHPFTMLAGDDDVRLTCRVEESDVSRAFLATMHEGGHALYDQGFGARDRDTLLADGASAGMHEGQARLWENHVGRSRPFISYLMPQLREIFPGTFDDLDSDVFWRSINVVRPGCSRIGADEMSYHLHIMLRYELETALVSGDLSASGISSAWRERSKALLGMEPKTDLEGALQDVHWAVGLFGYFPTYTIGSLYAAQLFQTYCGEHDFAADAREGRLNPLRDWLRIHVYEVGKRGPAEDIVRAATGRGLDASAFFAHLESPDRAWSAR
ncbi:MAG TPA: hypothetical protein VMD53_13315 [Rhizomicrobium sp.]|nr:hypothetical protein [Rhizomicrobium sp.]